MDTISHSPSVSGVPSGLSLLSASNSAAGHQVSIAGPIRSSFHFGTRLSIWELHCFDFVGYPIVLLSFFFCFNKSFSSADRTRLERDPFPWVCLRAVYYETVSFGFWFFFWLAMNDRSSGARTAGSFVFYFRQKKVSASVSVFPSGQVPPVFTRKRTLAPDHRRVCFFFGRQQGRSQGNP